MVQTSLLVCTNSSTFSLGTRITLNPPENIKFQWSEKGSYRLPQMLKTIENLPNRSHPWMKKDYAIYVLDNYAVHLMPEIKKALKQKGYILVLIGGGITGDIQVNDTDFHGPFKANYRELEMALNLEKLKKDPNKIPTLSRDEMMDLTVKALSKVFLNLTHSLDSNECVSAISQFLVQTSLLVCTKSFVHRMVFRT